MAADILEKNIPLGTENREGLPEVPFYKNGFPVVLVRDQPSIMHGALVHEHAGDELGRVA
jgi:hypothetical protein